jgi:predicted ATP-dependent endonuclease of OLD family
MEGYITENGEFPSIGFFGGKFNSTQFLISTHSPFIINSALELDRERYESLSDEDKKSFKPTHKVYHLDKVDGITKLVGEIPTTSSATQERNFVSTYDSILGSIGVQPSDLLFANGVIWVEGPSDAIYIEHWLKLYQEKLKKENPELKVLKKGSAYSFQMLNLICLNHTGANEKFWNDPESIQEAINLLEINRKFVVVIDNDGDFENCLPNANSESPSQRERKIKFLDKIKEQKKIISEGYEGIRNNEMDFWIGKEAMTIENYLKNLIAIKGEESVAQYDSKREKEIIIKNIFNFSKAKPEYTKAKAYYARQICKKFTNLDDFCSEGDELYTNIQSLYATIQSWNEPK